MKNGSRIFTGLLIASTSSMQAAPLISLDFSPNVTPQQQQIMSDAATFWNDTILGYDLLHDGTGAVSPHYLDIAISIPVIDGIGGTLGSAGPTSISYYDNNPLGAPTFALWYSTTGEMEFDAADVDEMIANNSFFGVVLHEMAHVIGIGTLWEQNNDVGGTSYTIYQASTSSYVGTNAVNAWQTEFGQSGATSVPVEQGGGPGTAGGHWNEVDGGAGATGIVSSLTGVDFSQELMTGWASNPFFLSTVTLGGLDDLGYVVDYSKAGLISYTAVPEPAAAMLFGASSMLFLCRRRRTFAS